MPPAPRSHRLKPKPKVKVLGHGDFGRGMTGHGWGSGERPQGAPPPTPPTACGRSLKCSTGPQPVAWSRPRTFTTGRRSCVWPLTCGGAVWCLAGGHSGRALQAPRGPGGGPVPPAPQPGAGLLSRRESAFPARVAPASSPGGAAAEPESRCRFQRRAFVRCVTTGAFLRFVLAVSRAGSVSPGEVRGGPGFQVASGSLLLPPDTGGAPPSLPQSRQATPLIHFELILAKSGKFRLISLHLAGCLWK